VIKTQLSQANMATWPQQVVFSPGVSRRPVTLDDNMTWVPLMEITEVTLILALEIPSSFYTQDEKNLSQVTLVVLDLFTTCL